MVSALLVDLTTECPMCGAVLGPKPLRVTGDELKPYQMALRADAPDKRVERLAKWISEVAARKTADGRPWKESAALHKFAACYGRWPDGQVVAQARAMARERQAAAQREQEQTDA